MTSNLHPISSLSSYPRRSVTRRMSASSRICSCLAPRPYAHEGWTPDPADQALITLTPCRGARKEIAFGERVWLPLPGCDAVDEWVHDDTGDAAHGRNNATCSELPFAVMPPPPSAGAIPRYSSSTRPPDETGARDPQAPVRLE